MMSHPNATPAPRYAVEDVEELMTCAAAMLSHLNEGTLTMAEPITAETAGAVEVCDRMEQVLDRMREAVLANMADIKVAGVVDVPTRVLMEITGDGYTTRVFAGDKLVSDRGMKMVRRGEARGLQKGDVYDDFEEFEKLAEELDELDGFGVACELRNLREDFDGNFDDLEQDAA